MHADCWCWITTRTSWFGRAPKWQVQVSRQSKGLRANSKADMQPVQHMMKHAGSSPPLSPNGQHTDFLLRRSCSSMRAIAWHDGKRTCVLALSGTQACCCGSILKQRGRLMARLDPASKDQPSAGLTAGLAGAVRGLLRQRFLVTDDLSMNQWLSRYRMAL